jgi:hypothetical protein
MKPLIGKSYSKLFHFKTSILDFQKIRLEKPAFSFARNENHLQPVQSSGRLTMPGLNFISRRAVL